MAHRNGKLSCRQVMRMLSDYLEGRLSVLAARRFRLHARHCNACRLALDSARTTLATYFPEPTPYGRAGA